MFAIQFRLPWDRPTPQTRPAAPAGRRPRTVEVGGREWPIEIARHRRARRYVLRMTAGGGLRLTVPRGASIDAGLRFVRTQQPWIGREEARRSTRDQAWTDGRLVRIRGDLVPLVLGTGTLELGTHCWPLTAGADPRSIVEAQLRAMATMELPARCLALAALHDETVTRVTIRNQRSRWGSCSTRATIALNWRLVQMPAFVSDYIILHELMHLRQPNHSRAFWREVASVCAQWREAEAWIRKHGKEIL